MDFNTLPEAVKQRVERDPQGVACVFLSDGAAQVITNEQLFYEITRYAGWLQSQELKQGDLVFLAMEHSCELIALFWGIVYLGGIPSILSYPNFELGLDAYVERVKHLAVTTQARLIVTLPKLEQSMTHRFAETGCKVIGLQVPSADVQRENPFVLPVIRSEDHALLQFTSGTTEAPKGIMFSHREILDHVQALAQAFQVNAEDVNVSWLPFHHDMGLIAGHILPLAFGARSVYMSSVDWIRHPESMMQAIHQYRGTIAWMPNFAFNYCVQRIREQDMDGLDLSSWRVLCNGSEPVQYTSLQQFGERFRRYGFQPAALLVGYGMAENVGGVTITPVGRMAEVDWVLTDELQTHQRAVPVAADSNRARAVTSCGYPIPGVELSIVNEQGERLTEREVGEIIIRSKTLFTGYYRHPELTAQALRDGWFYTGDVGYQVAGQLYVCDRKKDLIIAGGRNVHPQTIEDIAGAVFGSAVGRCVAFGISDLSLGTEVPVLVGELRREPDQILQDDLLCRVRQRVQEELGVALADVRFVRRGWVVKTTSGKVARAASRKKYFDEGYNHQPEETRLSPDEWTPERLQLIVTHLFERVLGINGVGPNDDFVKLGGDSLSALRLFIEIERRFAQIVSAAEFFQQPTVGHLAVILYRQMGEDATVETQTPPGLGGAEQQLHPKIKPQPATLRHGGLKGIKGLVRQKAADLTYKGKVVFMTWLYGQKWAQRVFARDRACLLQQFYALLENPWQSETEAIQCGLICDDLRAIQEQLLNQVFSHRPGYWSFQVDAAHAERAYQRGQGVILVGRHSGFNYFARELAVERLKPREFAFIRKAVSFLPEEAKTLQGEELRRLKLPIFLDQLLKCKSILARGGIVLVLPDGYGGLSRGVSLPFHGRMISFKAGFAELAIENGAAVIPVSTAADVRKREVTVSFLEPLDIGPADMGHAERVEGLVRQYAAFLKKEWARCPGIVPLRLKKKHLDSAPLDGNRVV